MTNLRITYYGYNGFIIESGDHVVAIDPGASLYLFGLGPVIPKKRWKHVTHIFVTHADPDHYWHADRMEKESGAPIICGSELVQVREGKPFIASPRWKTLRHNVEVDRAYPMDQGDKIDVDGITIRTLPARHGELELSLLFGLIKKTVKREPKGLFAKGETGFYFELDGVSFANLGDSMLIPEWADMRPDVLMIPIGGREAKNTMDEQAAVAAVEIIQPQLVIPCHYNCGMMFSKNINPADAQGFKQAVEARGARCLVMEPGQEQLLKGWPGVAEQECVQVCG